MKVWCVVYEQDDKCWVTQSVHASEESAKARVDGLVRNRSAAFYDIEEWDVEE